MANAEYHHLYNRAAWRNLRRAHLSSHPLCRMHEELGRLVPATVVDHVRPHRGDLGLFFDHDNLQSLCKPCHDSHKQAAEHSGLVRGAGHSGAPLDLAHPWHATPPTPGGGQISAIAKAQTAAFPTFATPQNQRGGL